jgi:hypothetical protein
MQLTGGGSAARAVAGPASTSAARRRAAARASILQRRMGMRSGEDMLTSLVLRKRLSRDSHEQDDRFEPKFTPWLPT